jgi:uncharacterized membrane protein YgdD (TMEM256/DUF423 family)
MPAVLLVIACLMGAGGVILSALGAHAAQGLDPAALMLLVHAPAVIAAVAAIHVGLLHRTIGLIGAVLIALGAILFAGDIALRVFAQAKLFAMAAPGGGFMMIGGWVVIAVSAVLPVKLR